MVHAKARPRTALHSALPCTTSGTRSANPASRCVFVFPILTFLCLASLEGGMGNGGRSYLFGACVVIQYCSRSSLGENHGVTRYTHTHARTHWRWGFCVLIVLVCEFVAMLLQDMHIDDDTHKFLAVCQKMSGGHRRRLSLASDTITNATAPEEGHQLTQVRAEHLLPNGVPAPEEGAEKKSSEFTHLVISTFVVVIGRRWRQRSQFSPDALEINAPLVLYMESNLYWLPVHAP